jgi:hypothetical protein
VKSPIEFYPHAKVSRDLLWLGLFFVAAAVMFAWLVLREPWSVRSDLPSLLGLAGFGTACGLFAWIFLRASRLVRWSRATHEPHLVIDSIGAKFRDSFTWNEQRIDWVDIATIGAFRHKGRTVVLLTGKLGKYGRQLEFAIDEEADPQLLNDRLKAFLPH